jgi:hypothetical protein
MRNSVWRVAVLVVAAAILGCGPKCEDRGTAAIQRVLPFLSETVVSNLVHEASTSIADAAALFPGQPFFSPAWADVPVAHGLRVDTGYGTGPTIVVRTHGASTPYLAVGVPVHFSPGLCLWTVYVCIKPGGGFARAGTGWDLAERNTNATPVVEFNNEVLLYAEQQSF